MHPDADFQKANLNIDEIIREKKITVHFQPIISVINKKICGLEGLIRGVDTVLDRIIAPLVLFDAARYKGLTLELDRACRERTIETFRDIYRDNKDLLLFLNIDASIIEKAVGSNHLINLVKAHGINPQNIVIEVNESRIQDTEALKKFIAIYRKSGFLIALDDVGSGFSNLDRIPLAKPDIIKIDIALIRDIDSNYYKQEVFKSLASLSNKIGALVVAEGVETEAEAIQIMELGGQMIQGYYFAKPQKYSAEWPAFLSKRIETLARRFRDYTGSVIKKDLQRYHQLETIIDQTIAQLKTVSYWDFNAHLTEALQRHSPIECGYTLDESGTQSSHTVCSYNRREGETSLLFHPAKMGTDHSMKTYYYRLVNAIDGKYLTEPYISQATGNRCVTFAKSFINVDNQKHILCMDFNLD